MKSTNVIDLAAWRAAHAPVPAPVAAAPSVKDELLALLMSLAPKAAAKPGSRRLTRPA